MSIPVTIITVAFKSASTISRTIESVMAQTYGNLEYIVVDGASPDGTADVARSYIERFNASGEQRSMRVISEPDKGMYDALNKGARESSGELVGQINADDWYEPDAVETMVALYEKNNYDAAWGSIRVHKPTGEMIKHAKIGRLWTTTHWCHPGMFSKREMLISHPYPLETMYDDFDYITSLHVEGKKIVTVDKVVSNFTFGGMSTKKSYKEAMRRVKITYGIYKKYGMSRFYFLHRFFFETAKFVLG